MARAAWDGAGGAGGARASTRTEAATVLAGVRLYGGDEKEAVDPVTRTREAPRRCHEEAGSRSGST
jgi:hypothetical protein